MLSLGPVTEDLLDLFLQVLLAPQMDLSDLPLKTFYRYALPGFSQDGANLAIYFGCLSQQGCSWMQQLLKNASLAMPTGSQAIFPGVMLD